MELLTDATPTVLQQTFIYFPNFSLCHLGKTKITYLTLSIPTTNILETYIFKN